MSNWLLSSVPKFQDFNEGELLKIVDVLEEVSSSYHVSQTANRFRLETGSYASLIDVQLGGPVRETDSQ